MKYLWTTIKVKDMKESVRFYKDLLGLSVKSTKHIKEGFDLTFLETDNTEIELLYNEKMDHTVGKAITFALEVESIAEIKEKLEKEDINVGKIQSPEDNMQFVMVTDPNGVGVQLVEYIK